MMFDADSREPIEKANKYVDHRYNVLVYTEES